MVEILVGLAHHPEKSEDDISILLKQFSYFISKFVIKIIRYFVCWYIKF